MHKYNYLYVCMYVCTYMYNNVQFIFMIIYISLDLYVQVNYEL